MDDLLLLLLSDEATEEELRRVDAQPHLLLPSLTRWVDERLHALLVDAAASGEAVAPRRAADLRAVASPTMAPRASAPAAVPKASDFPPLAAALPLGAALAAPRRVGGAKQRRRMAPTQVAVPSSSQTSVPSPAPFGQSADTAAVVAAAAGAVSEPLERRAQPLALTTTPTATPSPTPTPTRTRTRTRTRTPNLFRFTSRARA